MAAIDEKEYTQSFDWKIWKRLGPFLRPYRGAFVSMLVFNGICALVDVVLPLFQKYAIQNFIEKNTLTGLLPMHWRIWRWWWCRHCRWWPLPETPCTSR